MTITEAVAKQKAIIRKNPSNRPPSLTDMKVPAHDILEKMLEFGTINLICKEDELAALLYAVSVCNEKKKIDEAEVTKILEQTKERDETPFVINPDLLGEF